MSHQAILPNAQYSAPAAFVQVHPVAVPTTPLGNGALTYPGSNMMVDEQNSSVADQTNQSQPQSVAGMVPTLQ